MFLERTENFFRGKWASLEEVLTSLQETNSGFAGFIASFRSKTYLTQHMGQTERCSLGARRSDGHVSRESGPSHMRCSMIGGSDMIQNPETALQVSN